MLMRRFLAGLLFLCWTALAQAGADREAFTRTLAEAREEAYATPPDVVARLRRIANPEGGK